MENEAMKKITTVLILLIAVVAIFYLRNLQSAGNGLSVLQNGENSMAEDNEQGNDMSWKAADLETGDEAGVNNEDFFACYRMERNSVRASEMEMLKGLIADPNISTEGKNEAEAKLLALVDLMEKELMLENMLKAQGYGEAVFFLQDGQVNIVVQNEQLSDRQFLQIAEIVSNAVGVDLECIAVVENGGSIAAP